MECPTRGCGSLTSNSSELLGILWLVAPLFFFLLVVVFPPLPLLLVRIIRRRSYATRTVDGMRSYRPVGPFNDNQEPAGRAPLLCAFLEPHVPLVVLGGVCVSMRGRPVAHLSLVHVYLLLVEPSSLLFSPSSGRGALGREEGG